MARVYLLIIMLLFSTILNAFKDNYNGKIERLVLLKTFRLISLYFPVDELSVLDSTYTLDWFVFDESVYKRRFLEYKLTKETIPKEQSPKPSSQIKKLLGSYVDNNNTKFKAYFSKPYRGWIRCDVYGKDSTENSSILIANFLIRYKKDGIIYEFIKRPAQQSQDANVSKPHE